MLRYCVVLGFLIIFGHQVRAQVVVKPIGEKQLRIAASKAIDVIQRSQKVWLRKESCPSCHHALLPQFTMSLADLHGVPLDPKVNRELTATAFDDLKDLDAIVQGWNYIDVSFDGWWLVTAHQAGVSPSLGTMAEAQFVARRQRPDGSWAPMDQRPPQSNSIFTATAVCARGVDLYLPKQFDAERTACLARARGWLLRTTPRTTEDRTFQLLGLLWTGAEEKARQKVARQLLAEQRADGGWGQLGRLASDAYSTGQVLFALREAAGLSPQDTRYQRGLGFLLQSQKADGSWYVASRLHPPAQVSPPYFDAGFPHGRRHQFSSIAGSTWAATALLQALPPRKGNGPAPKAAAVPKKDQWIETILTGSVADLQRRLDNGLNPDAKTANGTTALMLAARDLAKVELLIKRGAKATARADSGIDALIVASRYRGNAEVVRLLLKHGARPNAPKGIKVLNDASALFFAAATGDVDMTQTLLKAGAKVDKIMLVLGQLPWKPMTAAILRDESAVVAALLRHGAHPEDPDPRDGMSNLIEAAIGNHDNVARVLLAKGAKVNYADKRGMTALHYAASIDFGDTAIVERLIAAGANVNARNKDGDTALDLANRYGHSAIAKVLARTR